MVELSKHTEAEIGRQCARLPGALLPWYDANARALPWRRDTEPYHVWLSEIMLQQTRVEAATDYYLRFLAALPTLGALARASEQTLLKLWEGLGYYTRARNLHKAAKHIAGECGGVFPDTFEGIRALPGVGDYTAGAVASISFERATPAVDGNVLRILARILEDPAPIDGQSAKKRAAARLAAVYPERGRRGAFTQALMELGATVCVPGAPRCDGCPAAAFCFARANGTQALLPVRGPKKAKKEETRTVLLLRCGERTALTKREDAGLLRGLWQLPNLPGALSEAQAREAAAALGVAPRSVRLCAEHDHIFTHIVWKMRCYAVTCGACADGLVWATPQELRERYALPTAFRVFVKDVER